MFLSFKQTNGPFPASFLYFVFSLQLTFLNVLLKIVFDWIRTRILCQFFHNRCPLCLILFLIIIIAIVNISLFSRRLDSRPRIIVPKQDQDCYSLLEWWCLRIKNVFPIFSSKICNKSIKCYWVTFTLLCRLKTQVLQA